METKQLEYFCAVVEEGTVSGAAKALNMTQPPVSYQMKMLEEYYCRKNCPHISLKELSGEHLILSHRYRNYMISAFEAAGLICDIYYECEDARTAMTIAEKGIGVAILPKSMSDLNNKLRVYEISDADLTTETLLVWRDEYLSAEVKNFIEEIDCDIE